MQLLQQQTTRWWSGLLTHLCRCVSDNLFVTHNPLHVMVLEVHKACMLLSGGNKQLKCAEFPSSRGLVRCLTRSTVYAESAACCICYASQAPICIPSIKAQTKAPSLLFTCFPVVCYVNRYHPGGCPAVPPASPGTPKTTPCWWVAVMVVWRCGSPLCLR